MALILMSVGQRRLESFLRWQATTCDMPGSGTDSAWCVRHSLQVCPDLHWTCQLVHLDQDVEHHWHIWLRQPNKVVVAEYRFNHDGQLQL